MMSRIVVQRSIALVLCAVSFAPATAQRIADRTVLLTDDKDNRLLVGDFRSGTVREVSRTGSGPGEYRRVGQLWAIGSDSSLMADLEAPRWLVLEGARVVATWPAETPVIRALRRGDLRGADRTGAAIALYPALDSIGRPLFRDSMRVLRADRTSGRTEAIARTTPYYSSGAGPVGAAANAPAPRKPVYSIGITTNDQVAVFADGWVAIARVNPYRVDWCAPARPCQPGPTIEPVTRMTNSHKRAHREIASRTTRLAADRVARPDRRLAGLRATLCFSAWPAGRQCTLRAARWPSSHRAVPHGNHTSRSYDVIDRRGARVGRLTLPLNERIAGFGASSVYITVTDAFDVQKLRRHPWP